MVLSQVPELGHSTAVLTEWMHPSEITVIEDIQSDEIVTHSMLALR